MSLIKKILAGCGVALFGYAAVALILSFFVDVKTTIDWYKQVLEYMAGGICLMSLSVYIDKIGGLVGTVVKKLTPVKKEKIVMPDKEDTVKYEPEVNKVDKWTPLETNYDFLTSLTNSLEKPEDKELCRQLQRRLLDIHHESTCTDVKTT